MADRDKQTASREEQERLKEKSTQRDRGNEEQFLREHEEDGESRWGTKAERGPDEAGPNQRKD